MIRARKIFSAARALPTTVSCITGMEPESQALARRVGPVESLVKHDPALRGPEPRLRCVPPTANICGGFGIFISGRARALRPDGGGRGGAASSSESRLGRERSLWSWLVRRCFHTLLSTVGLPVQLLVFPRVPFLACAIDLAYLVCAVQIKVVSLVTRETQARPGIPGLTEAARYRPS